MQIHELDKDKLEQCVINETRRLREIIDSLDKLRKEYEQKRYFFTKVILPTMEDKIMELEESQEGAKKFIEDCKNQLNKLYEEKS